jgi:hypothetical protein
LEKQMRLAPIVAVSFCFGVAIPLAHAEIGVPAAPGGIYLSVEGGYHQWDAPGVSAQGFQSVTPGAPAPGDNSVGANIASSLTSPPPGITITHLSGALSETASLDGGSFISADRGGYGGATLGYTLTSPLGIISRVELYGMGSFADESTATSGIFAMRGVDNRSYAIFFGVPVNHVNVDIEQRLSTREIGFRFKSDRRAGPLAFALSAEPFYIRYDQETDTNAIATHDNAIFSTANRHSDVSANLFGAQLALEAALPLAENLSLIGRGSAGVYNVSADGDFSSGAVQPGFTSKASVSDGSSRAGYRLGAEAGFRYVVNSSTWLSLTTSVDYLSEVPTAVLPRFQTDSAAHVGFDDLLDWRSGIRLTFATNGAP